MEKIINQLFLINALIISPISWASDSVNLNFTGNIRIATCNVSSGDNINVDLKNIPAANFEKANSASSWNMFNIEFQNCSTAINQIKLTFSGISDVADSSSLYKNQGSAENIAVQLENWTGTIKLGINNRYSLH